MTPLTQPPLITLTTDFGEGSHYVAQLKGVILGICRQAKIVDVSHRIAPQNIAEAAWVLRHTVDAFPRDTCHIAVVDPGVGTARDILLARLGSHYFVAPDNGVLWPLAQRSDPTWIRRTGTSIVRSDPTWIRRTGKSIVRSDPTWTRRTGTSIVRSDPTWIRRLSGRGYGAPEPSPTFHGRDIMAHVAALVVSGTAADRFGPLTDHLAPLPEEAAVVGDDRIEGRIVYIDAFGNLITNIDASLLAEVTPPIEVHLPKQSTVCRELVDTYGDRAHGTTVVLLGSTGHLEIAIVNGSAVQRLGGKIGDPIVVEHR